MNVKHTELPVVDIADHPSNLDPTAELVSSTRDELSIFRVRGGFVACERGRALVDLFPSQDAARSALAKFKDLSAEKDQ